MMVIVPMNESKQGSGNASDDNLGVLRICLSEPKRGRATSVSASAFPVRHI